MMKRLFITDLDGTFFNDKAQVTDISSEIVNKFISEGGYFTFATARTASSAVVMTKNININVPCILMNGVSIYDIQRQKYVKNNYFSYGDALKTAEIFKNCGVIPFMYKLENESLHTYYYDFNCREMYDFFKMRGNTPDRPFYKCENLTDIADNNTVYFSVQGKKNELEKVTEILRKEKNISYAFYRDVYNKNIWFLEVFSSSASKSNGVKFLREYGGFDHITCFGDNFNDLPMFDVCDKKIAVFNAKTEVKNAADEIIGSNNDSAVAFYLSKRLTKNFMNERKSDK